MLKLVHSNRPTAKACIRQCIARDGYWLYAPIKWDTEHERAIGELIASGEARWGCADDLETMGEQAYFYLLPARQEFDVWAAWRQIAYAAVFTFALWGFVLYCVWGR